MKIELTPAKAKLLHKVHGSINERIVYTTDMAQFGVVEDVDDGRKTGKDDCDGYAMAKHLELIENGFPEECLAIASCGVKNEDGSLTGHAVNIVSTTEGDLVLDNRNKWIVAWEACDYVWNYVPENVKDDG